MTDDRRPDEPEAPEAARPPDEPTPVPGSEAPPPLAPLVDQGDRDVAGSASETTVQPTSSWEQTASTPVSTPAPAASTPAPAASAPPAVASPGPQPAVSWAPAPAAVAVAGRRTTLSLVAGILLILAGILGGLLGLGITVLGSSIVRSIQDFGPIPEMEGVDAQTFISGFIAFFGIIIIVYSLVYLIAGIGVVRSREWGRILGIIVGILSGLVWLGGLGSANQPGTGDNLVGNLIALGIHVFIVVALLFFWRTKAAPSTA